MTQVLIVSADLKKVTKQFSTIASLYPTTQITVSDLSPEHVVRCSLVVVDLQGIAPNQVEYLRTFLKSNPQLSKLSIVDLKNRKEVLQAQEIGIFTLIDRRERLPALIVKIREILGNYSRPILDAKYPEKTVKSVWSTCSALDTLSIAAVTDDPLPMPTLIRTANDITKAIETDGLDNWLSAVQCHHSHTFCHTMLVAGHAVSLSKELGKPEEFQILLGLGALVHDLGKVKIPLSILDKPGKLSEQERELINKHPIYSKEILKGRKEVPKEVTEMAVWHHELLDGSGYPDRLKGDQISQTVRILTICDIYSALTEKRAYKDSYSPRQAFAIMFGMGGKLDKELLRVFRNKILTPDLGHLKRSAF
jgi:HD-GYP domain-containing protein (c-di-GMP phosphodiesterase class II)